jgi:hypothetical protein
MRCIVILSRNGVKEFNMTIQYVQIQTYDFGASLSDVTLRNPLTDAVIATADACPELSTDSGIYRAEFDETSAIAGVYRLRAVVSGSPLNRFVTLTGVDGELAYSRVEQAAVLDSASIDAIADAIGTTGGGDWSDTEKAQIRYRLGLNGTSTAPTEPTPNPIVITPGSGTFTTGYVTCFDQDGSIFPDCTLYQRMIEAPSGDVGYAYDSSQTSVTSASNGVAQFPKLVKGATYLFFRGKESEGSVLTIPTSAGATYALPSIVGR